MRKKKSIDPIPEGFTSYEEAAEFWDTHDTTDYPNIFRTIEAKTKFKSRHYKIEVEADVVRALQIKARQRKVAVGRLASDLLRQQLVISK
jgi:hypothetical protein